MDVSGREIYVKYVWMTSLDNNLIILYNENLSAGDKTKFWKDEWVRGTSMIKLFPRFYMISESTNKV